MAFDLPAGVCDSLQPYLTHETPSAFMAPAPTLLVSNITKVDSWMFGQLMTSPLPDMWHLTKNFPVWKDPEPTKYTVRFPCQDEILDQVLQSTQVLLYHFNFTAAQGNPPNNMLFLQPMQDSLIIPWYRSISPSYWAFHCFAGGIGGWMTALNTLIEHGLPHYWQIGIEKEFAMALQHAVTHNMLLIPETDVPSDFFRELKAHVMINADIHSRGWMQSLAMVSPDLWTISAPCQSWSSSGKDAGLGDQNGLVLLRSLGLARLYRPRHILLENVKGMKTHRHYMLLQQIIRWCGYRVLHEIMSDLSQVAPVSRTRFLQILERVEEPSHLFQWHSWKPRSDAILSQWDAIVPTGDQLKLWTPNHEVLIKYWDYQFVPAHSRDKHIRELRIPPAHTKMPVFMASYGDQHSIRTCYLQEKGLHGFFYMEDSMCRWFQPTEIAMIHQQQNTQLLLKPARVSWHSLGNMIAAPHAHLILANLAVHLYQDWTPNRIQQSLDQAFHDRIKMSTAHILEDELAWYLGDAGKTKLLQTKLHATAKTLQCFNGTPTWPNQSYVDVDGTSVSFHFHAHRVHHIHQPIEPTAPMTALDGSTHDTHMPQADAIPEQALKESDTTMEYPYHPAYFRFSNGSDAAFLIHNELSWHDVLDLWDTEVTILHPATGDRISPTEPIQPAILQFCSSITDLPSLPDHDSKSVVLFKAHAVTHIVAYEQNLGLVRDKHEMLSEDACLINDYKDDDTKISGTTFLVEHNKHIDIVDIQDFLIHLENVTCEAMIEAQTDTLVIGIQGELQPIWNMYLLFGFWHSHNSGWSSLTGA